MKRQALVVEDDTGLRAIYRRVLNDIGYEVLEAGNGAAAMNLLRQHTPNIMFLDILLPQVNGLEILEYVYNAPHLKGMYTVVVSSNKQYEQYAEDLGSAEFILKPIRPAQIRALASGSPA